MKVNRRTMLKGVLGGAAVAIGLPALELFLNTHGTAYAAGGASGFPKRFGLFFWGNGMLPDRWVPVGEGDDWQLSDQLAPLLAHKEKLSVVTGTRVAVPNVEPHHATAGGILTGMPILQEPGGETFAGPTIDQILAAEIGQDTLYRSLEFGSDPGQGLSHNGPHSINPAEKSPLALFERIFGGTFALPGAEGVVDPTLALRRSVLDVVSDDILRVAGQLGKADQARLEQHLEGVRALEKRLAKLEEDPPNLEACAAPPAPAAAYEDIEGHAQLQEKNKAFSDIIAMALACDQTRVFSNYFTRPLTNVLFEGISAGHHKLTHDEPSPQPEVHEITLQCMEALSVQIESLRAVEEGDGTLLDHMVLFATSDVSNGKNHSEEEFPILLAGSCDGALKTNRHYRSPSLENSSKALLTICRAMGLNLPEFGTEEGQVSDGISDIEV